MNDTVRCILFDLDGTLYDSPPYHDRVEREIVSYVAEKLGASEALTASILRQKREELGTLTRSLQSLGIDREQYFQTVASRVNPSQYIPKDPALQKTIYTLRREGFKVGLVSNSGRALVVRVLEAIGVEQAIFDCIVTSSEAQPKPSHQPFLVALKQMDCEVENAIYVGDRDEAELRPAKELGMKTILLDRTGEANHKWTDYTARSMADVERIATELMAHDNASKSQ